MFSTLEPLRSPGYVMEALYGPEFQDSVLESRVFHDTLCLSLVCSPPTKRSLHRSLLVSASFRLEAPSCRPQRVAKILLARMIPSHELTVPPGPWNQVQVYHSSLPRPAKVA